MLRRLASLILVFVLYQFSGQFASIRGEFSSYIQCIQSLTVLYDAEQRAYGAIVQTVDGAGIYHWSIDRTPLSGYACVEEDLEWRNHE